MDTKWVFISEGEVQPFEEPERYTERRIRDRLTSDMLERYCQAMGVDIFNANAYGPVSYTHLTLPTNREV